MFESAKVKYENRLNELILEYSGLVSKIIRTESV